MPPQLIIIGSHSHKKVTLLLEDIDYPKNLLLFLTSRDIPVASSCRGQGVCKKCTVSKEILSCSVSVKDYLTKYGNIVEISYF